MSRPAVAGAARPARTAASSPARRSARPLQRGSPLAGIRGVARFRRLPRLSPGRRLSPHRLPAVPRATGNLFIRLFEAEDDVTVRIVIDRSASMGMHRKLDQARRMAAAIGFVALVHRDTVILHTEPAAGPPAGSTADPPRRFSGRHATQPMFDALASIEAAGTTDLVAASRAVLARQTTAGVTVMISDLLSDDWSAAVDRLVARGGDTTRRSRPRRRRVAPRPARRPRDDRCRDRRRRSRQPVAAAALREYTQQVDAWLAETAAHCRRRGATYVRVMADDAPERVLLRGVAARTAWCDEWFAGLPRRFTIEQCRPRPGAHSPVLARSVLDRVCR